MSGFAGALGHLQASPAIRWRRRDVLVFAPLALLIGYAVSPFVAIARLGYAVQTNDVGVLTEAVDWTRVRAGLDRDIGAGPASVDRTLTAVSGDDDLPDFGQSFATQATASALETTVTPTGLEAILLRDKSASEGFLTEARCLIDGSVFIGFDRFELRLPARERPGGEMIRIGLRFSARHGWRVERVVLPSTMIAAATAQRD